MTSLKQLRSSSRWLVLLAVLAATAVATVALVPHEEIDGKDCLVCKAGHQPLLQIAVAVLLEPPRPEASVPPVDTRSTVVDPAIDPSSPRAPPV